MPPANSRRATLVGQHPTCTVTTMQEAYAAGDVIGTGSFGIIRKVTRRADKQVVARKELNYGRMDERDLKQLTEEVNILEQLGDNDHIVRYFERFVDKPNNMLYIIMEYCEGGDLSQVIQRCRNNQQYLPEELVWSYMTQLAIALNDCHSEMDSRGNRKPVILHRDLKPENVFLDKDSNLKLGDFGLSKAMAQAAMTNTYVGTPYYMSPELINGHPYDVKSDIWALGCLVYEMCAGHPPFHEARTQPELAEMIRKGKIPDLPSAYSTNLGRIVMAMLRQSPKSRPTSAQILKLDQVRVQRRVLELRKYHQMLKSREASISAREESVKAREQQLAEREQELATREEGSSMRERQLAARTDELRSATHAYHQEREQFLLAQQTAQLQQFALRSGGNGQERGAGAGDRPSPSVSPQPPSMAMMQHHASASVSSVNAEDDLLARVASRPSMVPRRPLEDRRSSMSFHSGIPFPRTSSNISLMSLDETPQKGGGGGAAGTPQSLRKRLASKSMHNLASAARGGASAADNSLSPLSPDPRRMLPSSPGGGESAQRSALRRSDPATASPGQIKRSVSQSFDSATASPPPPLISVQSYTNGEDRYQSRILPSPTRATSGQNGAFRPPAPARHSTAPVYSFPAPTPPLPATTMASAHSAPASQVDLPTAIRYDDLEDDDMPSPFLKKHDYGRFAQTTAQSAPSPQPTTKTSSSALRNLYTNSGAPAPSRKTSMNDLQSAPARAPRSSLSSRPSLASKLLATRAAQAVDESGRRVSRVK